MCHKIFVEGKEEKGYGLCDFNTLTSRHGKSTVTMDMLLGSSNVNADLLELLEKRGHTTSSIGDDMPYVQPKHAHFQATAALNRGRLVQSSPLEASLGSSLGASPCAARPRRASKCSWTRRPLALSLPCL